MNFLLSILCSVVAAAQPVPVILDTDLGDDIDDTWAVAMLLGMPEVDVKLIVTAADNTQAKTRLLAKILEQTNHTDIPIGIGKQTSENPINQAQWLGDYALDKYLGTVHQDGVQALIDAIHAAPAPITLCVIGPQTNIAEALKRDPSIAAKARIVSMAGSVHIGYQGKQGAQPEWNVIKDIPAAQAVFAAPWEITLAPLDICGTLILKGESLQQVANSENPLAKVVMENYRQWSNFSQYPAGESSVLFDTVATYLCFDESKVELETVSLRVDEKGNTVVDSAGRPVKCALRWKDLEGFEKLLVKSLTERP